MSEIDVATLFQLLGIATYNQAMTERKLAEVQQQRDLALEALEENQTPAKD